MPLELPGAPYICQPCRLKLWPASEAEKHKAWHRERERQGKAGEYWLGSIRVKPGRRRYGIKTGPTGNYKVKKEGISMKNVNKALN